MRVYQRGLVANQVRDIGGRSGKRTSSNGFLWILLAFG